MTTREDYKLIMEGRHKELDKIQKIRYWQDQKSKAEYWIAKYERELLEIQTNN